MRNRLNIEGILRFMKENHLSQKEFCKQCGFSLGVLHKMLKKQMNFRITALYKLQKRMGVPMRDLFVEENSARTNRAGGMTGKETTEGILRASLSE